MLDLNAGLELVPDADPAVDLEANPDTFWGVTCVGHGLVRLECS